MTFESAGSWSLGADDFRDIDRLLAEFVGEVDARSALLVDRTGQLITSVGTSDDFDGMSFASLAAADFSANDQLASLIGEEDFSSLVHQGEEESIYLADVARRLILVVLFDRGTTLGLVRLRIRSLIERLNERFRELFARFEGGRERVRLEGDWLGEAEDQIDQLFDE